MLRGSQGQPLEPISRAVHTAHDPMQHILILTVFFEGGYGFRYYPSMLRVLPCAAA